MSSIVLGQQANCHVTIQGKVTDESSKAPLPFSNVIIQEESKGVATNKNGDFSLKNICQGKYHLIVSHIGCVPKKIFIHITKDTVLNIALTHSSVLLGEVVVESSSNSFVTQPNLSVNKQTIEDNLDKNLSTLLENEAGVHTLKNGSGIAKPVVHGLYGNRLTILNNGIPQSGQQWGNDHSPEIDPLIANRITIIKGVNALEYAGGNLGSIILVEPSKIKKEPHLHGQVNYSFETNGKGNNLNVQVQKHTPALAWRVNGTLKKYGDRKSSRYFLKNTGYKEANFAVQIEKSWKETVFFDFYASTFNTELGVLRGSHIGNLTDLRQALKKDVPFFTEDHFIHTIQAPKQKVNHHLLKLNLIYDIREKQSLQFTLSGQINRRKEFDIRRGGRTNIPALDLQQYTYISDIKYHQEFKNQWELKIGNQTIYTDNTNHPETGILPLIPDYLSVKSGLFTTLNKLADKYSITIGSRYDYELQKVVAISKTVPRRIIRYRNNYHNASGTIGFSYNLSETQFMTLNTSYFMRNPAVNELYSNGLHQGVSGIERGDIGLKSEQAIKTTLEYKIRLASKFSFESLFYYQRFSNYIFLNPQRKVELTIRGAFPVFNYEQAHAEIYGLDMVSQISITKSLLAQLKYSFIRGYNLSHKIPLVNIPPPNINGSLTYQFNHILKFLKLKIEDLELELSNKFVFKQHHLLPSQDFAPPPNAYNLIGLKASTNIILPKYRLRFFLKVHNLANVKYRDYLNRQRYFANDLGRSVILGANFKF